MEEQKKHDFLKGALTGALAMLLICGIGYAGVKMVHRIFTPGMVNTADGDQVVNNGSETKLELLDALINRYYLYSDDVDKEQLVEGLYEGYVAELGDPYSVYYDEEATRELNESTSGEFSGIGAVLQTDEATGAVRVVSVYKDSPAEKAGIKAEDILYKVDGKDVTGEDLSEVVNWVKGEEGTDVKLTLLRGDQAEEKKITVTRVRIEAQTVSYEMKENQIGYIRVTQFEAVTYEQYKEALEDLDKQGMKGLVVDLRNNPGGNLDTVCDMLDLMLPKGTLVYTEDKNGNRQDYDSDDESQFSKPVVVLVNENSASASEIFSGAMQDYQAAAIVGTTTYGKGIVQQIIDLQDGTSVKLTVSEYFTPKGRSINKKGITPDVEVELNTDNADVDNQLDTAVKTVEDME